MIQGWQVCPIHLSMQSDCFYGSLGTLYVPDVLAEMSTFSPLILFTDSTPP